MTKSVRDHGYMVECLKPFKLPRYDVAKLPDPGAHVDCLVIANDRHDGQPRARLALSNGASWDFLAWVQETQQPAAQAVDVAPLVRQAVLEHLPAIVHQRQPALPAPMVLQHEPAPVPEPADLKQIATDVLAMLEMVVSLQQRVHEQDQRIAYLENNAADKTAIRIAGAA